MKFNEEELQKFREDFREEIQFLEKKYAIKITLGNIINDDTFFSARITAEHAKKEEPVVSKPVDAPLQKTESQPLPKKKVLKPEVEETTTEAQKIDPKAKELAKEIISKKNDDYEDRPVKSELKKAAKRVINDEEEEIKPKKKKIKLNELDLANLTEEEIEQLDLDSIELDEEAEALLDDLDDDEEEIVRKPKKVQKPEPKKVQKQAPISRPTSKPLPVEPKKPVQKKKLYMSDLALLTDDEIDNLDLDQYEIIEDEEAPTPVKKATPRKEYMDEPDIEEVDEEDFEEVKFRDEDENLEEPDFDDDEEDEKPVKSNPKHPNYEDMDIDDFFDKKESEPKSIFDEKEKTPQKKVSSYDDIDDILSSGGRYSYSFEAKMIQSEGLIQDYYTSVKNELLGYKGMSSRVSWDNDTFYYAKTPLAKVSIDNDLLSLYLALDCDEYQDSKYNFMDASGDRKYAATPMKYLIRKFKDVNEACELIGELMDSFGIENIGPLYDDYHSDYETREELIERGLIKKI